ncbi:MAG: PIG-L family deacetylase, partial [Lutimonas sp.]
LLLSLIITLHFSFEGSAQAPAKLSSSDIYHEIEKLNFLGTVLYLAAHPDDENTRMISYFSNEVHARTAYLSITRGDGGQNLIGPEIRELLGVIRTNELLRARQTDGGEQFFTRGNDFGYSKHPDETLKIWNKEQVLNDVVRVMREFQPDIIINRFNAESAGRTHGHHTSSAMLSLEAFDLAPDTKYETPGFAPWKPERIFFNTHWWFYGSREKFEEVDKSELLYVDIGTFYKGQGLSNSEIASLSRSMHKSQGFGSTGTRGAEMEYLQLLKGTMPSEKSNIFEGINTT